MKKIDEFTVRNKTAKTYNIRSVSLLRILFQPVTKHIPCSDKCKLYLTIGFFPYCLYGKNKPFEIFIGVHIPHRDDELRCQTILLEKFLFFFFIPLDRKRLRITSLIRHNNSIFTKRKPVHKL